jgi:hypothetical protein
LTLMKPPHFYHHHHHHHHPPPDLTARQDIEGIVRADPHGTTGEPSFSKRTSTAACFFDRSSLILNFKKPPQRSEPLRAKKVSLILRVCSVQVAIFFHRTVFHKCGRGIRCSFGWRLAGKKFFFHRSVTRTKIEPHLGRIFSSDESAPADRKDSALCKPCTSRRIRETFLHGAARNVVAVS